MDAQIKVSGSSLPISILTSRRADICGSKARTLTTRFRLNRSWPRSAARYVMARVSFPQASALHAVGTRGAGSTALQGGLGCQVPIGLASPAALN